MAEIAPKEEARNHLPRKLRKGSPMTNPPLTPLIDIFLFLIIFFLLSCQFLQGEGTIPASLPAIGPGPDQPVFHPDPLHVLLTARDSTGENVDVVVAGNKIDGHAGESGATTSPMEDLFTFLSQKRASLGYQAESLPVIIKPGLGVRWGSVVDAFNQAVRAGMKEVGVAPTQASSI